MLNGEYDDALATFQLVLMKEPANSLARINVGYICLKKEIFGEAIEHLSKAIRLDNDKKATLYAHYYLGQVYFEPAGMRLSYVLESATLAVSSEAPQMVHNPSRSLWTRG